MKKKKKWKEWKIEKLRLKMPQIDCIHSRRFLSDEENCNDASLFLVSLSLSKNCIYEEGYERNTQRNFSSSFFVGAK